MNRQLVKNKLEILVKDRLIDRFSTNICSIYSYGSANTSVDNFSDLDMMVVLNRFDNSEMSLAGEYVLELNKIGVQKGIPIDLHIYDIEEIPTEDNPGYGIFRTLFQLDYQTNRKLLYGKDILEGLPPINVKKEALNLISRMRRPLRQILLDPNTKDLMAKTLLGEGFLDQAEYINAQKYEALGQYLRYAATMANKSYLEARGIHIISKEKINNVILKEPFGRKFLGILRSRESIMNRENFSLYLIKTLDYLDEIYELTKDDN